MRPFAAVLIARTGSAQLDAQSPARIPLTAGLTKVNAVVNIRNPDYESFETIERIDAKGVHVLFSGPTIKKSVRRTVRLEDMKSSSYYLLRYGLNYPTVVPNTTSIGSVEADPRRLPALLIEVDESDP